MPTSLVIVESPAKARTIARFLGDDFVVEASIGAIRDLDPKGLAVDIDDGFKPSYVVPPGKRDVVRKLKAALKSADELYLATDEDRVGEAIAWRVISWYTIRLVGTRGASTSARCQAMASPSRSSSVAR